MMNHTGMMEGTILGGKIGDVTDLHFLGLDVPPRTIHCKGAIIILFDYYSHLK